MFSWDEVQRQVTYADKKKKDPDVIVCPKCGNEFFSIEKFERFRVDNVSGLCQRPAPHPTSPSFYLLRCICGEVLEPPLSYNATDRMAKSYMDFKKKAQEGSK